MKPAVFLFGEAERGDFCLPLHCKSLPQLADSFGHPPQDSQGIFYAIQSLLYQREIIFFRVREEGFSLADYQKGLKFLKEKNDVLPVSAIYLPGIGDLEIIQETSSLCMKNKSLLVITEKDLYDYLTATF
ncbi:MAG: hypothetical protein EBZ47_06835 [Chlamydiae bacterium]|nr:hypothetical protein [Chlamydiota bacterium]